MMNYTRLMPIQIGAKVADFSKPMVLLSDCHRRIEMFLGVLNGIAQLENRPLTKDEQGSLEKALRYFHEAAPNHTADEEQFLFPGLDTVRKPKFNRRSGNWNAWRLTTNAPLLCTLKSNCLVSSGWQTDI